MSRHAVLVGLGDYYSEYHTGYRPLPFVYKNVHDFLEQLQHWGWQVSPPLMNKIATSDNIIAKLTETMDRTVEGDTILFYFTGHGDRYHHSENLAETFFVSAVAKDWQAVPSNVGDFFTEIKYKKFVDAFAGVNRHLITIIDCCYAFGMIEGYEFQHDFHTVIASSGEDSLSYYNRNSLFFQALRRSWHMDDLLLLKARMENIMRSMNANRCRIHLANQYKTTSLK